jgi:excisionase family DNA binding protein
MSDRLAAAVLELVAALRAEVAAEPVASAPDRLLSVDEAAAALAVGRSILYSEIGAGRLRTVKVGRRRLVPASAIADYIASRS